MAEEFREGYRPLLGKAAAAELRAERPLTPTVLIGLGGSGGEVLLRVRKKIFERSEKRTSEGLPIVSYVFIDTDKSDKHVAPSYLESKFKFKPYEEVRATIANYSRILDSLHQYPYIHPWLYPELPRLPGQNLDDGAGQIRPYSRMAFFENFNAIRDAIVSAVGRASGVESRRIMIEQLRKQLTNDLHIYVIASLAGGTGSGMFIDLGYLLKTFNFPNCKNFAFLIFPRIFNLNEERMFHNAYASLKELEYFSQENPFEYQWERALPGRPIKAKGPYDNIYLVDGINEQGFPIHGEKARESIFEMLSEDIYEDFSASEFSSYKRGVRVNLSDYLSEIYAYQHRDPLNPSRIILNETFACNYSSFGLVLLAFPVDRIIKACSYKLAQEMMGFFISGEEQLNVRNYALDALKGRTTLYIGGKPGTTLGGIERDDYLVKLNQQRGKIGEDLFDLIDGWIQELRNGIKEGKFYETAESLSSFLKNKVEEKQRLYFKEDSPEEEEWLNWGEIYKIIHENKTELIDQGTQQLLQLVSDIIDKENRGVNFAKNVLEDISRIFQDDTQPYLPRLGKEIDELKEELELYRNKFYDFQQATFEYEKWGSLWPAFLLKKTTLDWAVDKALGFASEWFKCLTRIRSRLAAIDVIDKLIAFIGREGKLNVVTNLKEEDVGLIGDLLDLKNTLESLRLRYQDIQAMFERTEDNELFCYMYEPGELEKYYSTILGGTKAERQKVLKQKISEILKRFRLPDQTTGLSVIKIPKWLGKMGHEDFEAELIQQTQGYFDSLKKINVLDLFYSKKTDKAERDTSLGELFKKSKIWLQRNVREDYALTTQHKRYIVGVQKTDSPNYKEFERTLRSLVDGVTPDINIYKLDSPTEVIFYQEAAGFPLFYSSAIEECKKLYDKAEEQRSCKLHIDRQDYKFKDVLALRGEDRKRFEDAVKDFVLGVILGVIKVEEGTNKYFYEEQVGLNIQAVPLGIEARAIQRLRTDERVREFIHLRNSEQIASLVNQDRLPQYYAILSWYHVNVYRIKTINPEEGMAYQVAPLEYNVIADEIKRIETALYRGGMEKLQEESRKAFNEFDSFSKDLGNGKRTLIF
jgi:hypothetical protein